MCPELPIMLTATSAIAPAMFYPVCAHCLLLLANDIMHIISAAIISVIALRINLLAIAGSVIVCWSVWLCVHARCLPPRRNPCTITVQSHFTPRQLLPLPSLNTTHNHTLR